MSWYNLSSVLTVLIRVSLDHAPVALELGILRTRKSRKFSLQSRNLRCENLREIELSP